MKENAIIAELQPKISLCEDMKAYRQLFDLLYTIAKNFSLNYITKNYKYPQVSLDELKDLIMFGAVIKKSWLSHSPNGDYRALFPIPRTEIAKNANLVQNNGYQ